MEIAGANYHPEERFELDEPELGMKHTPASLLFDRSYHRPIRMACIVLLPHPRYTFKLIDHNQVAAYLCYGFEYFGLEAKGSHEYGLDLLLSVEPHAFPPNILIKESVHRHVVIGFLGSAIVNQRGQIEFGRLGFFLELPFLLFLLDPNRGGRRVGVQAFLAKAMELGEDIVLLLVI